MRNRHSIVWALVAILAANAAASPPTTAPAAKQRAFLLDYDVALTGFTPGETARVWLPVPASDDEQSIDVVRSNVPASATFGREQRYGNTVCSFEAAADATGQIPIRIRYRVTRHEVSAASPPPAADGSEDPYLQADRLVPIGGRPATLLVGRALPTAPVELGRVLYDLVEQRMEYRKDQPGWGRGDAGWACDSRFGNCTDFHSLFISLARTNHLAAVFEMGFGLPEQRGAGVVGGYHCWAKFRVDDGHWMPVDISEAKKHPEKREYFFGHICENRVRFSRGRDLTLVPAQQGPPLNFFVYPYAEVDGQPWPADRLTTSFAYQDIEAPATQP